MTLIRPPARPALVLAVVSGAQFMIILDLAIVNVALSAIQADFAVSQSDLQWVVIGYGLALGGFLLLGGRLADVLGRRRVLDRRAVDLRRRLLGRRAVRFARRARRLSDRPGPRRRAGVAVGAVDPDDDVRRGTGAQPRPRRLRRGQWDRGHRRADRRWRADDRARDGRGCSSSTCRSVPRSSSPCCWSCPEEAGRCGRSFDVAGAATVTAGLVLVVYAINRSVDDGWLAASTLALLAGGVTLLGLLRPRRAPLAGAAGAVVDVPQPGADVGDPRRRARVRLVPRHHLPGHPVPAAGARVLGDRHRHRVAGDVGQLADRGRCHGRPTRRTVRRPCGARRRPAGDGRWAASTSPEPRSTPRTGPTCCPASSPSASASGCPASASRSPRSRAWTPRSADWPAGCSRRPARSAGRSASPAVSTVAIARTQHVLGVRRTLGRRADRRVRAGHVRRRRDQRRRRPDGGDRPAAAARARPSRPPSPCATTTPPEEASP